MNGKDLTDDYIEGLLRDHFKAEVAELPATRHPWDWLEGRLETSLGRPGRGGLLGVLHVGMNTIPNPLVAALSIMVVLVGVTVWASTLTIGRGFGHLDSPESLFEPQLLGDPGTLADPDSPPGASPAATTFKDYERSRLASTEVDSVSTFSLDTDRTSFQLALNWARSGSHGRPRLRAGRGVDQRVRLRLRSSGPPGQLRHHGRRIQAPAEQRYAHGASRIPSAGASETMRP